MSTHKIAYIKPKGFIKIVYVKPKGLIRELAQKLFLELLLKMFPKQFLSYKNKIRTIMDKSKHYVSFVLLVAYLRFRYPHYINLPPKHIIALHTLIKFLKILKLQRIDFFLLAGSLLGAVRQGSFAGRPTDVDLGIKENQLSKLFDAFPLLKTSGVKAIRRFPANKPIRFQFLYSCTLVDVGIYRKTNIGKKKMWTGENEWKAIYKKKMTSKKKAASTRYYLKKIRCFLV